MKCPRCGSEQVHEMSFVTHVNQIICDSCNQMGSYYEFGIQNDLNIGLATQYDGAVYSIEQDLLDSSDPTSAVAITVHQVGEHSACNFWIREYGQWLKYIPERVRDIPPSPEMLNGEVLRFMQSPKGIRAVQDLRWRLALISLQDDAITLIRR